ncbi:serine/threonine-protein kinase [Actinomadura alba]|uniref:Protein kinase n=1 Tax=Actinomadura alba TaxID=406431 RepID=A0ABR7LI34_9ACTN|nr:protein kinase [Actinomadura alba]MBC6464424.1 protein kinase [Actinomadura alba]
MTGDGTQDELGGGAAAHSHARPAGPLPDIGPYRRVAWVGEGGLGAVYRGTDPAGRDVAIKVLSAEMSHDRGARRRLARDVDQMRRVRSPHVADVLDADVTADHPYVVTRFVPGRPLDEIVAAHGPLGPAGLRLLALGLAKALVAIHRVGAAHRDLRPSNVKLVGGEPVLIDFGVAQVAGRGLEPRAAAAEGATGAVGAEDAFTGEPGSSAQDVRAWAATVAFAATGRHLAELAGVPEPLRAVLESALDPDPARRPTAAALADTVAALPVEADELTSPEPLGRVSDPAEPPVPGAGRTAGPEPFPPPERVTGPSAPADTGVRHRPAAEGAAGADLAVAPAWARLFSYLVVATVVGMVIVMPIAGSVMALAGVLVLNAADAAERGRAGTRAPRPPVAPPSVPGVLVRGMLMTALTIPYAAVCAVTITLALVALAAVGIEPDVLAACAWGVGGAAYVLWAGPGVRAPRRQLTRIFAAVTRGPGPIALVGVALGTLAVAAVVAAISLTPSFAPMYELQNSLSSSLGRLQHTLQ